MGQLKTIKPGTNWLREKRNGLSSDSGRSAAPITLVKSLGLMRKCNVQSKR